MQPGGGGVTHAGGTGDDEAPTDPGARITHQSYTEKDFEGHRAHTVYVGVHLPGERRHRRHHKHHHVQRQTYSADKENVDNERPRQLLMTRRSRLSSICDPDGEMILTPPAQRVQFILGEEVGDDAHESHPLFSEMEELVKDGDEMEWKETARWIKFEEDVEEGGNRWSKPHVATLSLHALFELRSLLLNGTVMLDMEAISLEQVADLVLDNMINKGSLSIEAREKVREALLVRHRHQHERRKDNNMSRLPIIRSLADIGRNHSSSKNCNCTYGLHSLLTSDLQERRGVVDAYAPAVARSSSCPNSNTALLSKEAKDLKGPYLLVPVEESNSAPAIAGATSHGSGATLNAGSRFLAIPGQEPGTNGMDRSPSSVSISRNHSSSALENGDANHRGNTHFMRKIPPGAEASNILVGEVDFLDKTLSAFIRLSQATIMGDLTEVPVPTRFIFVLLGPMGGISGFHEIGRAMATLMSDEVFHDVAYKAKNRNHLLAGIDEFLDAVTVLPPGEWDPAIRIEPPAAIPSQEVRKRPKEEKSKEEFDEEADEQKLREESGLSRSGRLFGGLINDIRRKAPFYLSDFKDALALQCVASFIFLYFACLSPIITFGGLLGEATGKNMAAMESLVSGFVCGIGYGLFSGQPLTILGSTGPVLVFETIVYEFCKKSDWNYMSFRFWIGSWITLILLILVAIDASALVCYITRFTEENFATLIAFIFIYKAIENVLSIGKKYPINTHANDPFSYECWCRPPNESLPSSYDHINWTALDQKTCQSYNGTLAGEGCNLPQYIPDVFLMSIILFMGTFLLSVELKDFKNALFFPSKVRQVFSDFAVIIAIFSMSALDHFVNIPTPKLEVPVEFKPTLSDRGWMIWPFQNNPWWSAIVASLPALLGTILIFMDQQITAVIVNRKENKLKKGCGYHLDLFILAILIQICSVMGLPWFVAATVLSINHVNSLKLESECAAPGEKPQFLGVREQRATHILIFLMIGCSVLLTPMLKHIPMPVLFGVFLYMGVASLKGLQFFDRILIMLMPVKYQPDYMFLRQVPLKRVHLFTTIQLTCLACLWIIKSFSSTSILFPLMLVVMIGIRKSLDFLFTQRELKILDDVMPETSMKDDLCQLESGEEQNESMGYGPSGNIQISLANGNIMKIPMSSINISEEVNKTGIWQQVNESNEKPKQPKLINAGKQKKHSKKDNSLMADETTRLTTMTEEDENDSGISIKVTNVDLIRSKESISPLTINGSTSAETSV
ncbi:electrogenic sodium bicarbonate cotransporter 1 isoform X6 [Ceratina calcarata]|nr:electrogenic sodium bicarbonate cotransporter 1 isoform X6 [Ceratina calcarata]XP_026669436.1 electrogenic sodium bicarbonate cotransporter 1 isoform X6 [Ceratina calcarata]XP_026669441.1 electrogenic sodium bicarbonate cotransporter 1 isoform X6 [Ceratina calcarata]XP_026669446.1 electrogenic sodium bicarbonate cotransporter 1 isoform X6 [Ceratina calcarata]XP_026669447.1 electrogenic sodium bicarbonate cotransporter 1 isoform X6 [Ceratina calcarata]XP_026669449.1 electrogenic sodium bicar